MKYVTMVDAELWNARKSRQNVRECAPTGTHIFPIKQNKSFWKWSVEWLKGELILFKKKTISQKLPPVIRRNNGIRALPLCLITSSDVIVVLFHCFETPYNKNFCREDIILMIQMHGRKILKCLDEIFWKYVSVFNHFRGRQRFCPIHSQTNNSVHANTTYDNSKYH